MHVRNGVSTKRIVYIAHTQAVQCCTEDKLCTAAIPRSPQMIRVVHPRPLRSPTATVMTTASSLSSLTLTTTTKFVGAPLMDVDRYSGRLCAASVVPVCNDSPILPSNSVSRRSSLTGATVTISIVSDSSARIPPCPEWLTGITTSVWTSLILTFLGMDDLFRFGQVCHFARSISSQDRLWLSHLLSRYDEFCSCRDSVYHGRDVCKARRCKGTSLPQLDRLRTHLSRHPSFVEWRGDPVRKLYPSGATTRADELISYKTLVCRWTNARDVADPLSRIYHAADGSPFFVVRGVGAPFKSTGTVFDWKGLGGDSQALVDFPTRHMQQSLFPAHKQVRPELPDNTGLTDLSIAWLHCHFGHDRRYVFLLMNDIDTRRYLPLIGATAFGLCAALTLVIAWCTGRMLPNSDGKPFLLVSLIPLLLWVVAINCVMLRASFRLFFPFFWLAAIGIDVLAAPIILIACRLDFNAAFNWTQVLIILWIGLAIVLACVAFESRRKCFVLLFSTCEYLCLTVVWLSSSAGLYIVGRPWKLLALLVVIAGTAPLTVSAALVAVNLDGGYGWSWYVLCRDRNTACVLSRLAYFEFAAFVGSPRLLPCSSTKLLPSSALW
jgi:hypothetical protein